MQRHDTQGADIAVPWLTHLYLGAETRCRLLSRSRRDESNGEEQDEGWNAHRRVRLCYLATVFVSGVPSITHSCEAGRVNGSHVTAVPSCMVAITL